ncbi:hypothetical protein OIU84_001731 [Salix udensis]|uniref:Uncharacterized protein n=1 Tax=Salix udensis TaxID=889485 RepID=A0AAD6K7H3_9ROSI|nr:hypothetical protein OIU84_001731 [Salix udensis]
MYARHQRGESRHEAFLAQVVRRAGDESSKVNELRRREERAKAQQEEAELLAQKLAERLSESEQRRKFYLEQIRERASMDFRDQSSPLMRRSMYKEGQGRTTPTHSSEDYQVNNVAGAGSSTLAAGKALLQHSMKRRIKKIRQRLMALRYEFTEPPASSENTGMGYQNGCRNSQSKIWEGGFKNFKRLRQARKKGAASIGLITAEMIKFVEGKDPELQASRQAGLLDFIAAALPASHTSNPETCQVTIHLLKLFEGGTLSACKQELLSVTESLTPNHPHAVCGPLENYIKIAASLNLLVMQVPMNNKFKSRDGLLELLIAYQVIHRLRDLFALYDRPQVEGSPFPSSILLSIHLLVALTYRPGTNSSINWESSPVKTVLGFENQEAKPIENASLRFSSVVMTSEDLRPPLFVLNCSPAVLPPNVSEDIQLDESCDINEIKESVSTSKDGEQKPQSYVELNITNTNTRDVKDEAQKNLIEEKDLKQFVSDCAEHKNNVVLNMKEPVAFLLSAISETGLVSLPSLLTAVLLQANNRLSSEQGSYILPSNFEEVATGVLKVLNNLALLDIVFMQRMLVGFLLLECLSLLGYFALFHTENQAVLRWGKSPTILHKTDMRSAICVLQ